MQRTRSERNYFSIPPKDVLQQISHMNGWLYSRVGRFNFRTERFYYRLRWGFLTQHLTETSPVLKRFCMYESSISNAKPGLKVHIRLSSNALAYVSTKERQNHPRTLVLLGDDAQTFQRWLTCLHLARIRKIQDSYSVQQQLGKGADSIVSLGKSKLNPRDQVAIKTISLVPHEGMPSCSYKLEKILYEILLQHKAAQLTRHVAQVFDVFYDENYCHIVMQHCNGGSLSNMLENRQGALAEPFVRYIVTQIGRCILALHQANIVHRDVKCDNVLFQTAHSVRPRILLADFGFATALHSHSNRDIFDFCSERLGTQAYVAPEILGGERYGAPADIFSLGVVCYVCLVGIFPSMGRPKLPGSVNETRTSLKSDLDRLAKHPGVSPDAVSFCAALLNEDPTKRPIAAALLQHKWIREGYNVTAVARKRPSRNVHSKVVWRRMFHVLVALRALSTLSLVN